MNRRFLAALALIIAGASCTKEIQEVSQPVSEGQQMLPWITVLFTEIHALAG